MSGREFEVQKSSVSDGKKMASVRPRQRTSGTWEARPGAKTKRDRTASTAGPWV